MMGMKWYLPDMTKTNEGDLASLQTQFLSEFLFVYRYDVDPLTNSITCL